MLALTSPQQGAIATWLFCRPERQADLETWLKKHARSASFAALDKAALSPGEWDQLMRAKDELGIVVVEQHAGQLVFVPPGWPHYVRNECATVKVAWDLLELRLLPQCIAALRDLAGVPRSVPDYMRIEPLCCAFLRALVDS